MTVSGWQLARNGQKMSLGMWESQTAIAVTTEIKRGPKISALAGGSYLGGQFHRRRKIPQKTAMAIETDEQGGVAGYDRSAGAGGGSRLIADREVVSVVPVQ